jgi:glycosyl transferase family 25
MKAHLGAIGLSFELSPPVFLQGTPEELSQYDGAKRTHELGYPLTKGEVGCFLAHRAAWERVAQMGTSCLVMEDDARPTAELVATLSAVANAIAGQRMLVRFYSVKHPRHKRWKQLTEQFSLVRPLSPGGSTVAYLLTPECARTLLEGSRSFWLAVDEYMDDEASHGCVILHGLPEWVAHDDEGASMVGARVKPALSLGRKVFREWRRAVRNARQFIQREIVLWRLGLRL